MLVPPPPLSADPAPLAQPQMPGGLLPLVAYGSQNVIVSGNPQMSFFTKAFVQHSHFSTETMRVALAGPQELLLDASVRLRAKLPRHGDMLTDASLVLRLPEVYSKVQKGRATPHAFAWVRQVGLRAVERVGLYVGATKVQEWGPDYLAARAALDYDADAHAKWSWSIGDVPELYAPEQGVYADPAGGYPHASDPRGGNAPSIPGHLLRVPLGFFFSEAPGLALPLVALQRHDVEVQLTLRPLRELYTVLDEWGHRGRYGTGLPPAHEGGGSSSGSDWMPDSLNTRYVDVEDASGAPRHFWADADAPPPLTDGWFLDAHLEATYAFLTTPERTAVAARSQARYLVRQVQEFRFLGLGGSPRVRLDLDVHSLVTRLIWIVRRADAVTRRNDVTNLTNWKDAGSGGRPFRRPALSTVPSSSGAVLPPGVAPRFILRSARLLAAGNEVFEPRDGSFFADHVAARTAGGGASALALSGLLAPAAFYPVYSYAFALQPGHATQPSGSLNTSRLSAVQLEVELPTPPLTASGMGFEYDVLVFAEALNFFEVASGMGGMAFAV